MDDHTKLLCGLNFSSRNLLDSAAGGTFMEITLGDATKLLDNIMVNYSQWHTERSSNKKVPICTIDCLWYNGLPVSKEDSLP